MGRVLLIEPNKVSRQAISLFLFPEHEVRVADQINASTVGSLGEYSLIIIDGSSVEVKDQPFAELLRTLKGSDIPILWLEDEESPPPPKRERLLAIKKPLERETLQVALSSLLSASRPPEAEEDTSRAVEKGTASAPSQASFGFIELTDVVEEDSRTGQKRKPPRKPK